MDLRYFWAFFDDGWWGGEGQSQTQQISNNTAVWGSVFLFSVFLGKTNLNIFLTVEQSCVLGFLEWKSLQTQVKDSVS